MKYGIYVTLFAENLAQKNFAPEIKKAAREALKEIAKNPYLGKELQEQLTGFLSYKFMRYRIVYQLDTQTKQIIVWGVGHRSTIYEAVTDQYINATKH